MRKIMIHRPGGHDRLQIEEHPDVAPGPGEVAVNVEAIGINYADCMVRMGLYRSSREQVGWPVCPGFEVAGTVEAMGDGVDLPLGQRVFAVTLFNGYATRVVVPHDQVFAIPDGLDATQMAGFPTVFMTAWYGLHELCRPRRGQTMLVHSAAGGVGGALVQLGKAAGCQVAGVVGAPHKADLVRDLGADRVVVSSEEDLWAALRRSDPDGFHMVFDANGAKTLRRSYNSLRPPGKLVVYGFHTMLPRGRSGPNWFKLVFDYLRTPRFGPLEMTHNNRSVLAFNLSYLFAEKEILVDAMADLLGKLADGRIRPLPVQHFAFEDVAATHAALESGSTVGKLVLRVDSQKNSTPTE